MILRGIANGLDLIRRFGRDRSGASAVEFAIVGSVLVVFSIGIMEFGRAFFLRNDMAFAADVAVRLVMIKPTMTEKEVGTETKKRFDGSRDILNIAVTAPAATTGGMYARTITLTYPLTLMIPFLSNNSLTLTVVRRVEVPIT